jgi:hypothetical protein
MQSTQDSHVSSMPQGHKDEIYMKEQAHKRELEKKGDKSEENPGPLESGKKLVVNATEAVKEKAKELKGDKKDAEKPVRYEESKEYHQEKYEGHKNEVKSHGEHILQAALEVAVDAAQGLKDATIAVAQKTADVLGVEKPTDPQESEHNFDKKSLKQSDKSWETSKRMEPKPHKSVPPMEKSSTKHGLSEGVDYSHVKSQNIDYSSHISSVPVPPPAPSQSHTHSS